MIHISADAFQLDFFRCDENPLCLWFTYSHLSNLCFLKISRGYLRKRGGSVISGATFKGGCVEEPECFPPYVSFRHQCLYFPEQVLSAGSARSFCRDSGGVLPYDFLGYFGDDEIGDLWHWVNYSLEDGKCWACRPSKWGEGVRTVSCGERLRVACQRKRAFPLPIPPRPKIYTPERKPISDGRSVGRIIAGEKFPKIFCNLGKCWKRQRLLMKVYNMRRESISRRLLRRQPTNPYLGLLNQYMI